MPSKLARRTYPKRITSSLPDFRCFCSQFGRWAAVNSNRFDWLSWSCLSLLACLLACMHACLLACMHACMHACLLACLLACMHACLLACLLACLHACLLACLSACMRLIRDSGIARTQSPLTEIIRPSYPHLG